MRAAAGPTHEGSVIVVPPSNSDRRIRHYKSCASLHVQGRIGHPRHRREALGGWFAFGAADRIRYTMEKSLERLRSTMPAGAATAGDDASRVLWLDRSSLTGDNDVATLCSRIRPRSNISSPAARGRWS